MPTIIDALIVQLDLDPKSFDRGSREAIRRVDELEKQAAQSSEKFNTAIARGVVNLFSQMSRQAQQAGQTTQTQTSSIAGLFAKVGQQASQAGAGVQTQTRSITGMFAMLGRMYSTTTTNLTNAAQAARRGGQNIASGAQQGAASLQTLASAGLTAYASLKTVQTMLLSTQETAAKTAATGRQALAAGMGGPGVQRFSAMSLAAQATVGANPEQVQAEMAELQQALNRSRLQGVWDPRFVRMMQTLPPGVLKPGDMNMPMDELLDKIASSLQGKAPDERITWAQSQGFSRETAQFLALPDARRRQATRQAMPRAVTEGQVEELDKLREKIVVVQQQYDSLWRVLTERFSKNGLSDALEGFGALLGELQKNEAALKAIEIGLGVGLAAAVATAIASVGRVVQVLGGLATNPGLMLLSRAFRVLGILGVGGAVASGGSLPIIPGAGDPKLLGAPGPSGRSTAGDVAKGFLPWNWQMFGGDPAKPKNFPWSKQSAAGAEADVPGDTAPNTFLASQRARFKDELDKNPELKQRVAAMIQLENPGAGTAVVESLMNRMAMTGGSIEEGLHSGFYGPINRGQLPGAVAGLQSNPERMAARLKNIDQALAGSNIIKGHTDQGSAGDPNYEKGGVGININGERFNDWGVAGSREWRLRQQEQANKAAAPPPPSFDKGKQVQFSDGDKRWYDGGWKTMRGGSWYPSEGPQAAADKPSGSASATPLATYAQGSRHSMTAKQRYDADTLTGRRPEFPPGTKFNSRGEAYADTPPESLAAVAASMAAIRSGRGWGAQGGSSTNTSYNRDTTIGSVNIHTQATDAAGIARDIKGALDRDLTASDANMGLDY